MVPLNFTERGMPTHQQPGISSRVLSLCENGPMHDVGHHAIWYFAQPLETHQVRASPAAEARPKCLDLAGKPPAEGEAHSPEKVVPSWRLFQLRGRAWTPSRCLQPRF